MEQVEQYASCDRASPPGPHPHSRSRRIEILHDSRGFARTPRILPAETRAACVRPRSIDEVSACLRDFEQVLPVGAQSSLTGGATPAGDVVLSTERLNSMTIEGDRIRVGAGVPLQQRAGLAVENRPMVSAGADLSRRLRRRRGGDLRGRRGHVQVRHRSRMGRRPHRRARRRRRADVDARRMPRVGRAACFEIETAGGIENGADSRHSDARRAEEIGRLLHCSRAWISSISSSAPKARSA